MLFGECQSLEHEEVYAIVAYLLYMNDIVKDEEFILSDENFTDIKMPNVKGFVDDPRPDTNVLAEGEEPWILVDCR